jgi:hypothetical protein
MKIRTGLLIVLFLMSCLFIGVNEAIAGQLHVTYTGISTAFSDPGFIILGTIVAIDAAKSKVKILIKKIWTAPDRAAQDSVEEKMNFNDGEGMQSVWTTRSLQAGKEYEMNIYQGVVWDNPRKSPMDHRVRNAIHIGAVKEGQDILFLSRELLAANEENLNKTEIFFGKDQIAGYLKKTKEADLVKDLNDSDLSEHAYTELQRRNKLLAHYILEAKVEHYEYELLQKHMYTIAKPGQNPLPFLKAAHTWLEKNPDAIITEKVLYAFKYTIEAKYIKHLAKLVMLFDPKQKKDIEEIVDYRNRFLEYVTKTDNQKSAFQITDFIVWCLANNIENTDKKAINYFNLLDTKQKTAFTQMLFNQVFPQAEKEKFAVDLKLVRLIKELVLLNPEDDFIRDLAKIRFDQIKGEKDPIRVMYELLEMAIAIAEKKPSSFASLKKILDPWLNMELKSKPSTSTSKDGTSKMTVSVSVQVRNQLGNIVRNFEALGKK